MHRDVLKSRNAYPAELEFDTYALLSTEFGYLGCTTERIGRLLKVERGNQSCFLLETETSFTSLLSYRAFKNKEYAKAIFRQRGLNVPEGSVYRFSERERALDGLPDLLPAVVKPLDGNKGQGVSICRDVEDFDAAWRAAKEVASDRIIVERYFEGGEEARYLVVAGRCVAVSKRMPPIVTGNGKRSIGGLIEDQNRLRFENPDLRDDLIELSDALVDHIAGQGYSLHDIPAAGVELTLDWKASYATGDSLDMTDLVHESMKRIAERAATSVPGSDVIGVDILAHDHREAATDTNHIVVEANTRPGIGSHHYPVYGRPINVCRIIAEHCVRQMALAAGSPIDETLFDIERPDIASTLVPSEPAPDADEADDSHEDAFCLVLSGDTSLGDSYLSGSSRWADQMRRLELAPESFFHGLAPLISDKSFHIANLETVLADDPVGGLEGKGFLGWDSPRRTLATLSAVGVDAVSLANNHTMDFGPGPLVDTIAQLEQAGLEVIGAGSNAEDAAKPLKLPLGDSHIYVVAAFEYRRNYRDRYAFYATDTAPGVTEFRLRADNELSDTVAAIREADSTALIVAFPHWGGAENYTWATEEMVLTNNSILSAGADLVIGHGAHMLQHCAWSSAGTTVFSLGNFVFNSPGRYSSLGAPPYSLIARLNVWPEGAQWGGGLCLYPIVSDNRATRFQPRPVREDEAREVYDLLRRKGDHTFPEAFELRRDARGWHLRTTRPLSPRFLAAARSTLLQ